jgi:hypothetical protein
MSIDIQRRISAGSLAKLGKQKFKWNPRKDKSFNRNNNGMKEVAGSKHDVFL